MGLKVRGGNRGKWHVGGSLSGCRTPESLGGGVWSVAGCVCSKSAGFGWGGGAAWGAEEEEEIRGLQGGPRCELALIGRREV